MSFRVKNEVLLANGDMTQTLHSSPLDLTYSYGYSIQISYTGSPVGTLILEGSDDASFPQDANFQFAAFTPTNWTTLAGSTVNVFGPDAILYNFSDAYYKYVRVTYTPTSGSGTCQIVGNTKGS